MNDKKPAQAKIGGQALFEGIMMRGEAKAAMAVRKKDGSVHVNEWVLPKKRWYQKTFFIRGIFNFVLQLRDGYKYMMQSAEISGVFDEEEEPESRFEKWLVEKLGDKLMTVVMGIGVTLGIFLALFLFMFLPTWIAAAVGKFLTTSVTWEPLIAGIIRIIIFIAYMYFTSFMKDIHRTYEYHGAEHKTIAANEAGLDLTVENVRGCSRFHPRCGTSFIFLVLAISIIFHSIMSINTVMPINRESISSLTGLENAFVVTSILSFVRILFLPILVGISYEVLKLAGRYDKNIIMRIISAPGLGIQRLTTKEPDDAQIEIAIASFLPVLPGYVPPEPIISDEPSGE